MFLSRLSVRRPVMMTMVIGVFVVFGLIAYRQMPVQLLPDFSLPYVMVTTVYPGAGPQDVETAVLIPMEDALGKVNNVTSIRSIANPDAGIVILQLKMESSTEETIEEVRAQLERIDHELPPGAHKPLIQALDLGSAPVLQLAITGDLPPDEMTRWLEEHIEQPCARIDGVAAVELVGNRETEVQVEVDQARLLAHHLTLGHVVEAVRKGGVDLPAGTVEDERQAVPVRLAGAYHSADDVARAMIEAPTGETIPVAAVADVYDGLTPDTLRARLDGEPAVGVSIYKLGGSNTVALGRELRAELHDARDALEPGMELKVVYDASVSIQTSVNNLAATMGLCVLLTALMLWFFLHDLRGTAIVALSIPASIVASLTFVYLAGFSINYMTLMGLAITVGTLVDASIVVIESIAREAADGHTGAEAANRGTGRVVLGVLGSTVTNIAVFTPIAFMSGIAGKLFVQFALTIAFSMVFSLVMSFTLTPMLASFLYRKRGRELPKGPLIKLWQRGYDALAHTYGGALRWVLGHRLATLAGLGLIFVASMGMLGPLVSLGWFVNPDQGFFVLQVTMPKGTSLDDTEEAVRRAEDVLLARDDVELVYDQIGMYGSLFGDIMSRSAGEFRVVLAEDAAPTTEVIAELRPALVRAVPGADLTLKELGGGENAVRDDLMIEILGPDPARLEELQGRVVEALEAQPNVVDIGASGVETSPEIRVTPDKQRVAAAGLDPSLVAMALRVAVEGDTEARVRRERQEDPVRVRLRQADRTNLSSVAATTIQTESGAQIPLRELARVEQVTAPSSITRQDRYRRVVVFANLSYGSTADVTAALAEELDLENLEEPYRIVLGGEEEQRAEATGEIFRALLLAIVLTYMLLAGLLESLIHPLTILSTLPLALIGVLVALAATGIDLDIFGLMALVMLVGIVVNNAILMLEETNRLRGEGMAIEEALQRGALRRLRPILMTSLSTMAGMVPLALALGEGAELRQAMAIVSIGGVGISSVLILVACPVLYHLVEDVRGRLRRTPDSP